MNKCSLCKENPIIAQSSVIDTPLPFEVGFVDLCGIKVKPKYHAFCKCGKRKYISSLDKKLVEKMWNLMNEVS